MISFSYNLDDARELDRADRERTRRSTAFIATSAGPLLALAALIFLGVCVWPGWLCPALLPYIFVASAWRVYLGRPPLDAPDRWSRWVSRDGPFQLRATNEHIEVTSPLSRTVYRWTAFDSAESYETPRLFILPNRESPLVVPKRALSPTELEEFRALVDSHLGPKAEAKP